MHVNAANVGQPGLIVAPAVLPLPPIAAPLSPPLGDSVAGLLAGFSVPAIHAVLHLADNPTLVDALIHQAADAIARHDIPTALHAIDELLRKQPEADARILNEPVLAPIQTDVRELVGRVTLEAKIDAQTTIVTAAHIMGVRALSPEAHSETQAALALANRFLETGQYVNYIRAAELGRLAISWSPEAASASKASQDRGDRRSRRIAAAVNKFASLWRRAPVLVLLLGWLLLGAIVIPVDPELWGIGFLAIAGFQFIMTIRNWQGRR